jgi:uncharacterized membrane protein
MTLGPSLFLMAWLDKRTTDRQTSQQPATSRLTSALAVFGKVPMFYYILHLYLIHGLAVLVASGSAVPSASNMAPAR